MPELSHKEVVAELGRRWTALDDAGRAPFIELYRQRKAEYLVAFEKYKHGQQYGVELGGEGVDGQLGDTLDNKEVEMEVDGTV